jgi:hypothetical protein
MRRRIGELESALGVEGSDLLKQEEAGTLPVERDKLELAMMVQAYTSERRFIESQGTSLGTAAVTSKTTLRSKVLGRLARGRAVRRGIPGSRAKAGGVDGR